MASGWLQQLTRRLAIWTAPFLTDGQRLEDGGRTVVYHRWFPPMSYRQFRDWYRQEGTLPGRQYEQAVVKVCSCKGHLQAAQRWRDTCVGCGGAIAVGAVGLTDHVRPDADLTDFAHECGTQNRPTEVAVSLETGDRDLARRVRSQITDRVNAGHGWEDGSDAQQQRLLVADGLDAVCADLVADVLDTLHAAVSGEVQQENDRRRHQVETVLEAAIGDLSGHGSFTPAHEEAGVIFCGDQPGQMSRSRLAADLPVVPGSPITVQATAREAGPPDVSPGLIRAEQTLPHDIADGLIIAHNATLAAATEE